MTKKKRTTTLIKPRPAAPVLPVGFSQADAIAESIAGWGWWSPLILPPEHEVDAWLAGRAELTEMAVTYPDAPAEALYIRAGALGIHDGLEPFADLTPMQQTAWKFFASTVRLMCVAMDEAVALEAARVARDTPQPSGPVDLEGTVLELVEDPLGPSDFAKAVAERAAGVDRS